MIFICFIVIMVMAMMIIVIFYREGVNNFFSPKSVKHLPLPPPPTLRTQKSEFCQKFVFKSKKGSKTKFRRFRTLIPPTIPPIKDLVPPLSKTF